MLLSSLALASIACGGQQGPTKATSTPEQPSESAQVIDILMLGISSAVGEGVYSSLELDRSGTVVYEHSGGTGGDEEHYTRCTIASDYPVIDELFDAVVATELFDATETPGLELTSDRGDTILYTLHAYVGRASPTTMSHDALRELLPLIDRAFEVLGAEATASADCKEWVEAL